MKKVSSSASMWNPPGIHTAVGRKSEVSLESIKNRSGGYITMNMWLCLHYYYNKWYAVWREESAAIIYYVVVRGGGGLSYMPLKMLVYVRVLKAFQFQLVSMLKKMGHIFSHLLFCLFLFFLQLFAVQICIPEGMHETYQLLWLSNRKPS